MLELEAIEARGALVVVELGPWAVVVAVDKRFLASATAPVAAGLVTVRVVGAVELVALGTGGFGEAVLAVALVGFRAAAVVEAVPPVALLSVALLGDAVVLPGRVEVRRAVVEDVARFFSSSETDGWLR